MSTSNFKIGVLVSGRGSNLQSILDAILTKKIRATLAVVISNNPKAAALDKARKANVPTEILISQKKETREAYDQKLVDTLKKYGVELVILAGFMRILSSTFLTPFKNKVINIHPSLLPKFPGLYAQKQALEAKVKTTGCTVHFVDEGCDTGPIILQSVIEVKSDDTLEALEKRILLEEHKLLPKVIDLITKNKVKISGRIVTIEENIP